MVQLRKDEQLPHELKVLTSDFISEAFYVRADTKLEVRNRKYLLPIYNLNYPYLFLLGGRQIEKTTTILVKLLLYLRFISGFKALYVMPLQQQARRVSRLQYNDIVRNTPILREHEVAKESSIEEKTFKNQSKLFFLYLSVSPDRLRGLPGDYLVFDELQDMLTDSLSIVRQSLKHSRFGYEILSGTAKLVSSPTHSYWINSTGYDWAIKCPHCGRWQFLTPKNIGKNGPICYKCGGSIKEAILDENARWIATEKKDSRLAGFRINQLMNPDIVANWDRFLWDIEQPDMTEEKLYNEVFGFPHGLGQRPFSEELLKRAALTEDEEKYISEHFDPRKYETYIGVDWEGEDTYTAVAVLGFPRHPSEKVVLHFKVFDDVKGMEPQLNYIHQMIQKYQPEIVAVDYGMGQDRNAKLVQEYGSQIAIIEYSGKLKQFIKYDRKGMKFIVNRTRAMAKVVEEIKNGKFRLPKWSVLDKYKDHFLSIYRTETKSSEAKRVYFDHDAGKRDDLYHAIVFSYLGYLIANRIYVDFATDEQ